MPVIHIRPIAKVRPAVGLAPGCGAETADCAKETLPSAQCVCYDLLLFTLIVLFVPSVMLFCVVLWFGKSIKRRSFVQKLIG